MTDLLEFAPTAAVADLLDLTALAGTHLLPRLQELALAGPTWPGPAFAGSILMPADADLVVGHTLVEIKAVLGRATAGSRRAVLDGTVLNQVLGYVLHDYHDAHAFRCVALYQARYGHLTVWDLQDLLHQLAGGPVDLPALRERWRHLLIAGKPRAHRRKAHLPRPHGTRRFDPQVRRRVGRRGALPPYA